MSRAKSKDPEDARLGLVEMGASLSSSSAVTSEDTKAKLQTAMGELSAQGGEASTITTVLWTLGSIMSSVGLIMTNKVIMKTYGFSFVLTLTAGHFTTQWCLLSLFALVGVFEAKKMSFKDNTSCAVAMVSSVAFMNFSLRNNSVGFYQITKLACVPIMVLLETMFYGKIFSRRIKTTLCMVIGGVGVAMVTDVELNASGCVFGVLAVMGTTFHQIWTSTFQRQYGLKGYQFPHSMSSQLSLLIIALAFVFEVKPIIPGAKSVLDHAFQEEEMILIGLSCLMAISVNVCTAGVIRVTSPVTYQVVGHAKTLLVLTGGFLLFPLPTTISSLEILKNLAGISVAFVGVVVYGNLKMAEKENRSDWCLRCFPGTWCTADASDYVRVETTN